MKNVIITLLSLAIIGLGGWTIYNGTIKGNTAPAQNTTSDSLSQPSTADVLDLSNKGLTKIGPEVYGKTNTAQLILSNNNLKTLPSEMGKMTRLEVLKLDHNSLDGSLIGEVRLMPLKTLDVSNNNMTGMPAEIGQLNKLESLNYSNNHLTGLPNELAHLKNNLKTFNLSGNPLSQATINKLRDSLPYTNIIF